MKKILVLLLVCALIFSLMISVTSCIPQTDNSGNNNNQGGDNNQGDNNQGGDNNQDGDNTGDSTVEPGDSSINDKGSIDTPPIPVGSTDNRG